MIIRRFQKWLNKEFPKCADYFNESDNVVADLLYAYCLWKNDERNSRE